MAIQDSFQIGLFIALLVGLTTGTAADTPTVRISAHKDRLGMGRTVTLTAQATRANGEPAAGYLLLPYVNGARWGHHEYTDAQGRATFLLPLPNPGLQELQVEIREVPTEIEEWIWARETADNQTVYFQGNFTRPEPVSEAALWVAVDDAAAVYLNGEKLGDFGGWTTSTPAVLPGERLRAGENVLSVEARNGVGPAGLLVRLTGPEGQVLCVTGDPWRAFDAPPEGWPGATPEVGTEVANLGRPEGTIWTAMMPEWPTLRGRKDLLVGRRLPAGANVSNTVPVRVEWRELQPIPEDPDHLVGMQWEPWFTPRNANWSTAQAVPVVGLFWSWNRDVTRQHFLWLIESGVNFLVVDWTNHLWDRKHWNDRSDHTNEIIHATQMALEVLASMRDEGLPVPRMVLYLGLNNGPATTMGAVNEEIEWIHHTLVRNPRFQGLFQEYLGQPLLLIHNGGGPGALVGQEPVNEEYFTVRWQSSQSDQTGFHEQGFWSWMDGSLEPMLTRYKGEPEALTVSTAFFSSGGWTADTAYGRRNGWTYVESFKAALKHRPRFIELHQFNEFAGQPEGSGYGPNHDVYVDSYSVELSDDIEPVSLTAPGYRGDGGWGFLFLNLTRALVDLYRQETPETTVVAIGRPLRREVVTTDRLEVVWTTAGKPPDGFTLTLNDRVAARHLTGTETTVDLSDFPDGPIHLLLTAEGTKCRYLPSYTEDSLPLEEPVPAFAEVDFTLKRGG